MSTNDDKAAAMRTEITRAVREATGLHERYASEISDGILRRLQQRWGRDRVYIPVKDRETRDQAVREDFDGRNHNAICKRYNISRSTLYRIIGRRSE